MLINRFTHALQASTLTALIYTLTSISNPAQAENITIAAPGAPLELTWFQTGYTPSSDTTPHGSIAFRAQVENRTTQAVLAYGITFFAFDAFNEPLGGMTGVSMNTVRAGSNETGNWSYEPLAAFRFEKYGTGVAILKMARMADGTVWKVDPEFVLEELRKMEASLTMDDIEAATAN